MRCLICDQHTAAYLDEAVWSDDLVWAGHMPADPAVYKGWLLVETVRHAAGFEDLDDAEAAAVGVLAARLARAVRQVVGAEHVYAFRFGDGIPHFHLHLVPRYPETPREFWGTRLDEWPGGPRVDEGERRLLIEQIRRAVEDAT